MHLHLPSSDFFSIVKIKVIGMKIKVSLLLATAALSLSAAVAQEGFRTIESKKCQLYKVVSKDTWSGLSRKYHKEIDELKAVNPGINDLKIGQIINIPIENTVNDKSENKSDTSADIKTRKPVATINTPAKSNNKIHVIEKGETLFGIARKYDVSANDIRKWNHLENDGIKAGQKLIVSTNENITVKTEIKKQETTNETILQPLDDKKLEAKNSEVKNDSKLIAEASNKLIPPSPSPSELEYKPLRTEVKRSGGKTGAVIEVNETGMASWIRDGDINQSKFYALHRNAPPGTIIKVTNRMNGDYVFVKVVGTLPDTGDNDKQILKMSEAAAKRIGAINEKFQVELNYGTTN